MAKRFAAGSRRNLTVTQEGDRLKLRLHTASAGPRGRLPAIDLGPAEVGVSQHLALTYTPGHLRAYLNGEPTVESREMKSGFFHWQRTFLRLGGEGPPQGAGGDAVHWPWRGRLEGVAVYDRVLSPEEVRESSFSWVGPGTIPGSPDRAPSRSTIWRTADMSRARSAPGSAETL